MIWGSDRSGIASRESERRARLPAERQQRAPRQSRSSGGGYTTATTRGDHCIRSGNRFVLQPQAPLGVPGERAADDDLLAVLAGRQSTAARPRETLPILDARRLVSAPSAATART